MSAGMPGDGRRYEDRENGDHDESNGSAGA
jgi:hypothetical protein